MCKFYSAIIRPNGDLLHDIHTSSHEDIIDLYDLNDDKAGRFAKIEYTSDNLMDLSTYELKVDEDIKPEWLTDSMLENAERKLYQIVKKRIITEDRKLLMGGIFVVAENVKIDKVKNAIIEIIKNSTVKVMCENSTVNAMRENSTVNAMRENSTVNAMRENSTVNAMWENSTVKVMWENSTVKVMWENSTVKINNSKNIPKK